MPTFQATDENNRTVTFEWEGQEPPSDADIEEIFASAETFQPQTPAPPQQPVEQDIFSGLPVGEPEIAAKAINLPFVPLQALLRAPGTLTAEGPGQGVGEPGTSILDVAGLGGRAAATAFPGAPGSPEDPFTGYDLTPEFGAEVAKVAVELGTLHPYTVGMGKLFGAATRGLEMLASRYGQTTTKIDSAISKAVKEGMSKGVKPTVVGKGDAGKVQKFFERSEDAVLNIIENSEGVLPKTLEDFSQAIHRTKKIEHNVSSTLALEAGQEGAGVSLAPMRADLESIINQPNVVQSAKDAAQNVLNEIAAFDVVITPSVAEDLLATFNAKNNSFWKNPNFNAATEAVTTERFSNQLRAATDRVIKEYRGPGWQESRRRYGALRSIEKQVTDRATVDLRKNTKGFFDLADIASASKFATAIAKWDPAFAASGVAIQAAKRAIKLVNDPNRKIKTMFSDVNRLKNAKNNKLLQEAAKANDVSAEVDSAQLLIGFNPVFSKTRMEKGVLKSQVWRNQLPGTIPIEMGGGRLGQSLKKPGPPTATAPIPKALEPNIINAFEPTPEEFANITRQARSAAVKTKPRPTTPSGQSGIGGRAKVERFTGKKTKPPTISEIKNRRSDKALKQINDLRAKKGLRPISKSVMTRFLNNLAL